MLTDHDQDVLPRCRRLGHEITFGYCRRESLGQPCRLILNCWWEQFDVRFFLAAHFPTAALAQVQGMSEATPPGKVQTLLDIVQQAKDRLAGPGPGATSSKPPSE